MGDVVLELKGIVKSFPGVLALDGIDFELKSGEVHAICGENGAGKSTLMKVVCGVHKPDKGIMKVNGKRSTSAIRWRLMAKESPSFFRKPVCLRKCRCLTTCFWGMR